MGERAAGGDWAQQLSDRLSPARGLDALIPADAHRYGEPAPPETEEWAREIFAFGLPGGVQSAVSSVYVRRDDSEGSISIQGGFPGVGRWDLAITTHGDGTATADIQQIHIRGSRQGEGIGTAWVRQVEDALRSMGVRLVTLYDQSDDGTGRSFWERMGYIQRAGWNPGNLEKLL